MNKIILGLAATIIMSSASVVTAHHSFSMFDFTKTVDVKGTIKEFRYTNPHSWIIIVPQAGQQKGVEVSVEANGPGYLVRNGWRRTSLKPGDLVTVSMNPLRDGSPGGTLIKVTFPDGRQLTTR